MVWAQVCRTACARTAPHRCLHSISMTLSSLPVCSLGHPCVLHLTSMNITGSWFSSSRQLHWLWAIQLFLKAVFLETCLERSASTLGRGQMRSSFPSYCSSLCGSCKSQGQSSEALWGKYSLLNACWAKCWKLLPVIIPGAQRLHQVPTAVLCPREPTIQTFTEIPK